MNFGPEFFRRNRQNLMAKSEADVIAVAGNVHMQRSGDTPHTFRQESNFWYLTGISEAGFVLVLAPRSGEEFIILPEMSEYMTIFDGTPDVDHLRSMSDISVFRSYEEGWQRMRELLTTAQQCATIAAPKRFVKSMGIATNPGRHMLHERLKKVSQVEIVDITPVVARLRQIKQPPELHAHTQAIHAVGVAYAHVREHIGSLPTEYDVSKRLRLVMFENGAHEAAYEPIVASAENAVVLHYTSKRSRIHRNKLLLLDTVAEVNNYSSDISRTYPIGQATRRQRDIYEAVYAAHQIIVGEVKPGASLRSLHQFARETLRQKLSELSLDADKIDRYFPHAIGHYLGLDVHDVGDPNASLEQNMVLTIEPGLYIPEEGIGVRIEDDILVTANGHENLSSHIPSSPEALFG